MSEEKSTMDNSKQVYIVGYALMVLSIVFVVLETEYFGRNLWPGSKAELACDLTSLCMTALALRLFYISTKIPPTNQ